MGLFTVRTSKKIDTSMRLEESTAKMLDRYAHFHKGSADDVVNESLEYIFKHDKEFQQHLTANPTLEVPKAVRVKKVATPPKSPKSSEPTPSATRRRTKQHQLQHQTQLQQQLQPQEQMQKTKKCALRMKSMTLHPFQGVVKPPIRVLVSDLCTKRNGLAK